MPASRARIPARQGAARRVAGVPTTSNPFAVTAPSSLPAAAAVGIVQARRRTLRYLLLGDVTLVLDLGHGIRVLTDNRVHRTARAERYAADEPVPVELLRFLDRAASAAGRAHRPARQTRPQPVVQAQAGQHENADRQSPRPAPP